MLIVKHQSPNIEHQAQTPNVKHQTSYIKRQASNVTSSKVCMIHSTQYSSILVPDTYFDVYCDYNQT